MKKFFYLSLILLFANNIFAQETPISSQKLISVIGVGDIMLGTNFPSDTNLPPNDGKDVLKDVKEILRSANVTFGNLEGCFLNSGGGQKTCGGTCYFFRMPDRYVNYLVDAGFDVVSLANNHNGDFGVQGRENTQKVLKNAGINFAGLENICETTTFTIEGIKYGFCAFAPNNGTVRITDIPNAKRLVSELKKNCDIVIVSFHGGAEGKNYNRVPKQTETFLGENRGNVYDFAHAVIDAGADIVFGHGPHVVRAIELYKGRFIAYSLGNFATAGGINVGGISGYAPIIKIYTDEKGNFVKGQIFSFIQQYRTGPLKDDKNLVIKEIKRLTELDFPNMPLKISDDGIIEKR